MKRLIKGLLGSLSLLGLLSLGGCAAITDGAKGIAGISTKVLEEGRNSAISKAVAYDYQNTYNKTLETLTRTGSYIYAKNPKKQMLAIYISETDTTPVGIFFKEIDAGHTRIEVSSPSTYAKELISKRIFLSLEKSLHPDAEKSQIAP